MPSIVLTDIVKRWKDFYATDHVSLDIPDKSFITLLGPSGCGKTTILRRIAGLETPTSGQIKIGDKVVFDSEAGINIPANKRDVGFLFQNYALWPNRTVYQNITFGLKNVKEKLPVCDFKYKTRKDVIRVLQDPNKVIKLVNDAKDKKGRIIDSRAIIKIIDEFTVSQYTAKEVFKLHLENGDVENKVALKISECNAALDQRKAAWMQKDIQVLDDGQLVQIPGYNKVRTDDGNVDAFLKQAYALEKAGDTLKEENRLFGVERKLSEKNQHLANHIEKRKEARSLLPLSEREVLKKDIQIREENIPAYLEEKDKINEFFEEIKDSLFFLGDDSIHRTILLLQQRMVAYATNDEKKINAQMVSNNKTMRNYSLQISEGIEPYFDKLISAIGHGTLDEFYSSLKKEISYLPKEDQNKIIKAFEYVEGASYKVDHKANKAARKRFLDQAERVVPEAKDNVLDLVNHIDEAKKNHAIKAFYEKADDACLGTEEAIRNGLVEFLEEVVESVSHPNKKEYKEAHDRIREAAASLVKRTYAALEPKYKTLKDYSMEREKYTSLINSARGERNIAISKINGKACHLSKVRALDKEEIELKLRHAARIVKVEEFRDRFPNELSGGQQQRVAIARTLAPGPKVLFRDEPLSNLDAKLRLERRSELKRLHRDTGATFVYVTHDQLEARTLATHICLLNNGVLQQYDAPLTVYRRPNNLFVADFVGNPAITFIETKVKEREDGSLYRTFFNNRHAVFYPNAPISLEEEIKTRDLEAEKKEEELLRLKKLRSYVEKGNKDTLFNYHRLTEDGDKERRDEKVIEKDDYVIGIRPEFFTIAEQGKGMEGKVYSAMPSGRETTIRLSVDGYLLTSVIFGDSDYSRNETLEINTKGKGILLFDKVSGKRISSGLLEILAD